MVTRARSSARTAASTGSRATSASTSRRARDASSYNPNSGVILRANLDGTNEEIFASGLRNPQDFAFDEYGNIDQPGQRRRSSDRAGTARLHRRRHGQRLAHQLAVRQVRRSGQQQLQGLDGRGDVEAALDGPGGVLHAAHRVVALRPRRFRVQPGHGARRRVEGLLLQRRVRRIAGHLHASRASRSRRRAPGSSSTRTRRSCAAGCSPPA